MMTACASPALDIYDPDAVIPQNSPLLVATKVNTRPTPSPPPDIPLVQVSPSPSPGSRKAKRRPKGRPSQGDAVLISIMDDGRRPEIATKAGQEALPSDSEEVPSYPGSEGTTDDEDVRSVTLDIDTSLGDFRPHNASSSEPCPDLKMLADNALAALALGDTRSVSDDGRSPASMPDTDTDVSRSVGSPASFAARPQTAVRRDERPHPVIPAAYSPGSFYSPRTASFASPTASSVGHGELAPIQNASPRSESNGAISLPSLKDQLGPVILSPGPYSPAGQPHAMRLPSISHASPPISPDGMFPRSPHAPLMAPSPFPPWPTNGMANRPSVDFTGSTTSDHSVSSPATATSVANKMSLDGLAFSNPAEIGQYVCRVPGCRAPPFQTQYLLSSHANVHSQARPHYCPVKGCPRAEGGRGFKRKNEMNRHGLVHESPGYVCPFCLDREHKYPRPDNLQRHCRVHHPDKDKDDPLLRDVLSRRPDGPSRGRRRRGAT